MKGVIAFSSLAALMLIVILILVGDCARRRYMAWRALQDMRIRNERLARYNLSAFRGAKDRHL